ncbi:MAG: hypothetical protein MRK02_00035 [Candidatus Scalindua sp.]|nr:hypothetical protein [Candidatus Scalindua sp.]
MQNTFEGFWFRSHRNSTSKCQCGLYKDDIYYQNNVYDDVEDESNVDDRVAVKENEKLLDESEIIMGIKEFLEIGMKYKIKIEIKENRYLLEIENL